MHHLHYHLMKYHVFWQPERNNFLHLLQKYFPLLVFYLQCPHVLPLQVHHRYMLHYRQF